MAHDAEEDAVLAVIHRYLRGYLEADETELRGVFASDAVMNGYVGERLIEGTPEPFIQRITQEPALSTQIGNPTSEIEFVSVSGNAATVVLKEYDFGGHSFTDHMHLLKRHGDWKIISKTFSTF